MKCHSIISIALLVWLRETRYLRVYIEKRSRDNNKELKQITTAGDNTFVVTEEILGEYFDAAHQAIASLAKNVYACAANMSIVVSSTDY